MLQRNSWGIHQSFLPAVCQDRAAHLLQELRFRHDGGTQPMPRAVAAVAVAAGSTVAIAAGLRRRRIVTIAAGLLAAQAATATA